MNPDQQIELYRAARSIAWSYRLQDYNAAALKDLQRIVDKSKGSIINRFENQLGAIQREGSYTRSHYKNSLAELERLSLGLRNQLGEQLTTSTSRIGSLALKEWGESLSVGGVAKKVNTVALSPEQFAAFFKRNPPAGILIPKVMKNALNQGVTARIEGELLDVLREGALTGQSYKRIVDKLSESFTDFSRHQLTTLTRTFFQTANAQAFDAVYQANQDIMEGKIWTNVNDDRVCLLCLPLGETLYKKGESHPPMPRHPNCRCVFRAKTVSYRSLGVDVDELEEVTAPVVTRGYEKNGKWIIPPAGTGTGRRPQSVSFYKGGMKEAFPDLPAAQQKAMLGVGRYNKYKAGDLTLDQLVDKQTGKLWLLKELDEGMHLRVPDVPVGAIQWNRTERTVAGKSVPFFENQAYKKPDEKTSLFIHETSNDPEILKAIMREGLDPELTDAGEIWYNSKSVLSSDVKTGYRYDPQIEVSIPKSWLDDGSLEKMETGFVAWEKVPPEWIKGFYVHPKNLDKFENAKLLRAPDVPVTFRNVDIREYREKAKTLYSSLTPEEMESLKEYKRNFYQEINDELRETKGKLDRDDLRISMVTENIDSAIQKSASIEDDMIFYRGVADETIFEGLTPKSKMADYGFTSSSASKEVATDFATDFNRRSGGYLIEIEVPKGSKVGFINNSMEQEVLFPRFKASEPTRNNFTVLEIDHGKRTAKIRWNK